MKRREAARRRARYASLLLTPMLGLILFATTYMSSLCYAGR